MDNRARITPSLNSRVKKYDTYNRRQAPHRMNDVSVKMPAISSHSITVAETKIPDTTIPVQPQRSSTSSTQAIALDTVLDSLYDSSELPQTTYIPVEAPRKSGWIAKSFYGLGFAVFMLAGFISVQSYITNLEVANQQDVLSAQVVETDDQGVPQGTGSEPAEDVPDDTTFFNYRVAPEKPRFLRIPEISSYSRVKEVGTTPDGAVDAPWNIHDASWYEDSVLPGSKQGVSLLVGHVSGRSAPGVFKKISSLKNGSTIEVERGDGTVISYEVERIEEYPLESIDMSKILYEVPVNTHSLRLMTCSGEYNKESRTYSTRTVVYANPVN